MLLCSRHLHWYATLWPSNGRVCIVLRNVQKVGEKCNILALMRDLQFPLVDILYQLCYLIDSRHRIERETMCLFYYLLYLHHPHQTRSFDISRRNTWITKTIKVSLYYQPNLLITFHPSITWEIRIKRVLNYIE